MPVAVQETFQNVLQSVLKFFAGSLFFSLFAAVCLIWVLVTIPLWLTLLFVVVPAVLVYRWFILKLYRYASGKILQWRGLEPKTYPAKPAVPAQGVLGKLLDATWYPLMLFVSGTLYERPQRTHPWNNLKFPKARADTFQLDMMVTDRGNPDESPRYRFGIPLFHLRILGGWEHFIVLKPKVKGTGPWHVGWETTTSVGVTTIVASGPVRVLVGNEPIKFFGLLPNGTQIPIIKIGHGKIGDGGLYRKIRLL